MGPASSPPTSSTALPPADLLSAPARELTPSVVSSSLRSLAPRAQLLVAANLVLGGRAPAGALRAAVDIGLEAGEEEAALLVGDVRARCEEHDGEGKEDVVDHVKEIMGADAPRAAVVRALVVLRDAKGRLDTFDVFHPPGAEAEAEAEAKPPVDEDVIDDDPWAENDEDVDMPPVLDDPWAEDEEPVPSAPSTSAASAPPTPIATVPPIDAATFVLQPLVLSALHFATAAHLPALRITCQRHAAELWPYRLALIDAVPAWVSPGEEDLLPLLLSEGEEGEGPWPRGAVVPPKDDGPESPEALLSAIAPQFGIASLYPAATTPDLFPARADAPLSKEAITEWYTAHVLALDDLGLLDAQLAWVQHGTAFGVTGLDAIGEELSLLSRLIYDASLLPQQLGQWSLRTWRDASEDEIVQAYLANTTADTIVDDLRRLVLPYLYVLESRAERAGAADPALVSRMLHGVILDQPLHLALPCFEASKATLPAPARLVKDDQTVARLALAVLYGSDAHDAWATMSAIFECLPVWDVSGGDVDTDREATETTLDSIAAFVRPASASAGPGPHSARDLFVFFHPLPFASLSRALDILDVHLESGEILARYSVRVVLRTLLQSARDRAEQVTLAEHMVRRSTARADERRWVQLWEDMCRLQGGSDALLRGAFGMLSKHDMMRIFLGGLLASGVFPVAKKVIRRLEPEGQFSPQDLEDAVLTTSNEFYMRAETGNIHTGEMKLAYECLAVTPQTDAIRVEQDFIQATSRITSFRSTQLSSLTPAEIRHTPNKLDLIRTVLSTSDDAYRHTGIILELTDKLGFRGDRGARAEVLAMMCDAAVAAEEWAIAKDRVDEMVAMAEPDTGSGADDNDTVAAKVRGVTYRSCLALGRQTEYPDQVGRMALLAQALALCPADDVPAVLKLWRSVASRVSSDPAAVHAHALALTGGTASPPPSASAAAADRVLGSRTAARAASAAKWGLDNLRSLASTPASRAASGISPPASRGDTGSARVSLDEPRASIDSAGSGSGVGSAGWGTGGGQVAALFDDGEGVRKGARRALVKGVGWLLGAEDGEVESALAPSSE